MVKKAGDWTAKLFDVAQRTEYREVGGPMRNIKVMLNGPYGAHAWERARHYAASWTDCNDPASRRTGARRCEQLLGRYARGWR